MKCCLWSLNPLKSLGFNLDLLGFDDNELAALLEPDQVGGLTDEDAVPDVPELPVTVEGDVGFWATIA